MSVTTKRRVAILRGGAGKAHEQSLKDGGELLTYMFENLYPKWQPHDIFVDKEGLWYSNGRMVDPADLFHQVDLVWNMSDPSHSQILKHFGIPYIGIDPFPFALKESREMLKTHIKNTKICLPMHIVVPVYQKDFDISRENYAISKAHEVFRKIAPPYLVRSLTDENTMGIHSARTFDELVNAIYDGALHDTSVLVEELVVGKDCTVHTLRNFRGEEVYQMLPKAQVGDNLEIRLSPEEKAKVREAVENLHFYFESPNYIQLDLVINPRGVIYLKDFNFIPKFNEDSHLAVSSSDLGLKTHHILEHILENALN